MLQSQPIVWNLQKPGGRTEVERERCFLTCSVCFLIYNRTTSIGWHWPLVVWISPHESLTRKIVHDFILYIKTVQWWIQYVPISLNTNKLRWWLNKTLIPVDYVHATGRYSVGYQRRREKTTNSAIYHSDLPEQYANATLAQTCWEQPITF